MAEKTTEKPVQDKDYKHIVRVVDVDLPGAEQIHRALTNIKGIGVNFADIVCKLANIKKTVKAGNLKEEEVKKLNDIILNPTKYQIPQWIFNRRRDFDTGNDIHVITGTLTFNQDNDLKRMKKVKSYKGLRHQKGLTVRGQRTKSNFRKNKCKVVFSSRRRHTR